MRGTYLLTLFAAATLLPAGPALAGGNTDGAIAVDPKDKLVCKRTQATGSRFYKQICKTAAQWDAMAEQQKRDLREHIDRPQVEIRR